LVYIFFVFVLLLYPYSLGEVELFEESNLLRSPAHVVPEWYFTLCYAILRRIPSKGLGVLIIIIRIIILFMYPMRIGYITPPSGLKSATGVFSLVLQFYLSYLGFIPISQPFIIVALISTFFYFFFSHYKYNY